MSGQPLRIRRELRDVCAIGKPPRRSTLMTGMRWDATNNAESHGDINNFLRRQIARGLVVKEQK